MSNTLTNVLKLGFDRASAGPLYIRLRQVLQDAILDGTLVNGTALPAERDIADFANVSRVTVRKAIDDLVDHGLLTRRQGSGTFVAGAGNRIEQSLTMLTSFSDDMAQRGINAQTKWLQRGIFDATPREIMTLGLRPDGKVTRLSCVRFTDNSPSVIERTAVPVECLPDPAFVTTSLYSALEKTGSRPVRAMQRISACNISDHDAKALNVLVGSAGLSAERIAYNALGKRVELTVSLYRGDAYDFIGELVI